MSTHVFGYAASIILLATLATQIRKQWERRSTKGVSRWLFIGQLLASIGFTIHSAIIGSTLFVVVNALLAVSAVVGMVLWFVVRRRERRDEAGGGSRGDFDAPRSGELASEVRA